MIWNVIKGKLIFIFFVIYFLKGVELLNLYMLKLYCIKELINYEIFESLGLSNIYIFILICKFNFILEK